MSRAICIAIRRFSGWSHNSHPAFRVFHNQLLPVMVAEFLLTLEVDLLIYPDLSVLSLFESSMSRPQAPF